MNRIEFDHPADNWNEALPIGNGRMGGMIFGTPYTERIQLNEDSVWYGAPKDRINPDALDNLPKIRSLIFEGRIKEAQELCALALSGLPENESHYEPLGNLFIEFGGSEYTYEDYHRMLDIDNAVVTTSFRAGDVTYKREYIASYPAQAVLIHLTADCPKSLSFQIQLGRGNDPWDMRPYSDQILRRPNYIVFCDDVRAYEGNIQLMTATCGGKDGIGLAAGAKVIADGGKMQTVGNTVRVDGADEALIIVCADTTFRQKDPASSVLDRLSAFKNNNWDELVKEHMADYRSLYDRVKLDIEGFEDVVRFFQYGRYLLIASSRPGSLPANLQGIWNNDYAPAWGSRYTININTQMNYWPALVTNLAECHEPLTDLINRMKETGRDTAKRMYGCGGFMAHHNTDIWADTAPQDVCISSSYWVMGAAWLSLHIWEQYLFTADMDFLKENYPTMREAAEFVMDYLTEDGDLLVCCPSLSPENTYILPNGEKGVICKGASMDNQIATELLSACIKAEEILKTDIISTRAQKTLDRIPPIRTGKHGQIMEWNEDYEEDEPGHRHISQLFALYPGSQITEKTPQLFKAAADTIERRLSYGGGHSGWSRAWIINLYARLGEGDRALENICKLINDQTLPNLFDDHPPFQIDGNFGCCAGIAEMLVQSHEDEIKLLPALPKAWKNGRVEGLRLRGGRILKLLEWKDGRVVNSVIENI